MYRIVTGSSSHQHFRRSLQLATLEDVLPDAEAHAVCHDLGYGWRNRLLPPGALIRSMVHRGLHADHSIAGMLADLASLVGTENTPTDSAWCQARDRLPEEALIQLQRRLAKRMRRQVGAVYRYQGRPIFIVDGTGVSMPDTPELVNAFGYTRSKQYASRFPVARVTVLGVAGVNALWDYRIGEYRTSEDAHFHEMWDRIPWHAICLFDRYFSSFYNIAKLRQRNIAIVSRLHQRRDPQRLIALGRRLGQDEWLVPLELAEQTRRRYDDDTLPKRLWVRLIRTTFRRGDKSICHWLVTTLCDADLCPREEIIDLYRRRWEIETRLGEIKTTLQADILRSKTPGGVRRELAAILLGHNVVWWMIHQANEQTAVPAEDISFAGAARTVLAYAHTMAEASRRDRPAILRDMLHQIARQTNHHPKGRIEPRLIRRDPVRYGILREPRGLARLKCLT